MTQKYGDVCCNPSFRLMTKAKGLQGCMPRESPGVTSHTPESVEKCERVNPHTPKVTPTLGNGVPRLQKTISGVKTQWLVVFFISLESSWNLHV